MTLIKAREMELRSEYHQTMPRAAAARPLPTHAVAAEAETDWYAAAAAAAACSHAPSIGRQRPSDSIAGAAVAAGYTWRRHGGGGLAGSYSPAGPYPVGGNHVDLPAHQRGDRPSDTRPTTRGGGKMCGGKRLQIGRTKSVAIVRPRYAGVARRSLQNAMCKGAKRSGLPCPWIVDTILADLEAN